LKLNFLLERDVSNERYALNQYNAHALGCLYFKVQRTANKETNGSYRHKYRKGTTRPHNVVGVAVTSRANRVTKP